MLLYTKAIRNGWLFLWPYTIAAICAFYIQAMKRLAPVFRFYYGFAPAGCWAITVLCANIVHKWGRSVIAPMLFFKLIVLGLVYYFVSIGKKKEMYFYYNLGYSRNALFAYCTVIDMALFIISLLIVNRLS